MTKKEAKIPETIVAIKVSTIKDIARLAATSISMGQLTYLVRFKHNSKKKIIGTLAVFRDYYNMYGIPLFYYVECGNKECEESSYISFKIDDTGENIIFTNKNIAGTIMIPIIEFAETPKFIEIKRR